MEQGTLITGLVCILLCITPFVIMAIRKKKANQKIIAELKKTASGYNAELEFIENSRDFAIGLDCKSKTLLFKTHEEDELPQVFNLTEYEACKQNIVRRKIEGKGTIIERLELILVPNKTSKNLTKLQFFDTEKQLAIANELELIKIWSERIQLVIKK